ncbi:MAG TPA: bifunctional (p)ppGpp synthetase/guanosine-3',5'-bis(diphosphate) 3'-pyrophosphohydrolase [Microbacteriaceae bacterium]|nr:bifunctional (p)ppGpp synthetase/guanosine-3',5'-bis(diphosphate) 3'-pyrophosphohydrolase [Microbacteriaceae bacterium]
MSEPAASASLLSRIPRIFSRAQQTGAVDRLLKTLRQNQPKADLAIVERAYEVAERAHRGQVRRSGEPYITHPVAVAQILADLGLGSKAISAALLHDTVEDTDYSLEQLRSEFGDEIAMLVDGVTKLDKVKYGDSAQAETVRKMIVAMSRDIRVLVIKLADRLHNARTWGFVPAESATRKAKETLEIYAPLAHRLGIQALKLELEDLSFSVLHPKLYVEIENLVKQRDPQREEFVQQVIDAVRTDLRAARIKGEVEGRPKQYYSIYQKMVVRGRDFDDIYDLTGIRVLVSTVRDCYAVLGAMHARWTPIPGRFKDYIATPKYNLYQSLHTTVIGPGGRAVEIQIRTHDMHQRAEYGVAAHWKYKERVPGGKTDGKPLDADLAWLARITEWQEDASDPGEFLEGLRFEIGAKEVYVFTPGGKVIGLPNGATPVDFAYAVHTEVGHRTMGAKVNGRLVPLNSTLASGDTVEVLTSKNPEAGPSQDWLGFVRSTRAKSKIKTYFTKERREVALEHGRDALAGAMRKANLPLKRLMSPESLLAVAGQLNLTSVDALYAAIGEGHVSSQSIIDKLLAQISEVSDQEDSEIPTRIARDRQSGSANTGVLVRGDPSVLVKLSKCCTPVPGDDIVGFVTRGAGVSVHRSDCSNVKMLRAEPERMIDVEWAGDGKGLFLVQIQVEALDRAGLLSDITRVLSEYHVNILSANVSTSNDRIALSRYLFEMGDATHLDRVLNAVRRIDAVYDVYRVKSS